jgi:hypothetical protein
MRLVALDEAQVDGPLTRQRPLAQKHVQNSPPVTITRDRHLSRDPACRKFAPQQLGNRLGSLG